MSASGTLNLANYTTVWSDNFAGDSSLNTNLWPVAWGNGDDFAFGNGGLTLTSYAAEGWSAVGFMQADNSPAAAQGYGLYSATFSADAGQGAGICIVMWPANNVWPGAEIDLTEDWSNTDRQSGNATIHWAGAGDSNQYQTYSYSANMTQPTTVAMDWEPGSLTFYVNGQQAFQYTGAQVPLDAAQGGVNESFGAEVTAAGDAPVSASVSLNLYSMSYSTLNSTSTPNSTTTTGTTTTGTTTTGTTTTDSTTPATPAAAPVINYVTAGPGVFYAGADNQETASGITEKVIAVTGNSDMVVLGAPDDWVVNVGSGTNFYFEAPGSQIYDEGSGNTINVDPAAGAGIVFDIAMTNGDMFNLGYALVSEGWDGTTADLTKMLSVVNGSWGLQLSIHPDGGAASSALLYVVGAKADVGLATFLQHAIV